MWEGLTSSYLEIEVSAVDLFILKGGQKKKKRDFSGIYRKFKCSALV